MEEPSHLDTVSAAVPSDAMGSGQAATLSRPPFVHSPKSRPFRPAEFDSFPIPSSRLGLQFGVWVRSRNASNRHRGPSKRSKTRSFDRSSAVDCVSNRVPFRPFYLPRRTSVRFTASTDLSCAVRLLPDVFFRILSSLVQIDQAHFSTTSRSFFHLSPHPVSPCPHQSTTTGRPITGSLANVRAELFVL